MHGAGNDYIYVNTLKYTIEDPESFAKSGAATAQASGRTVWF
jgi:diaminopimelate epimerase (EC 5.1.1.7)